jgi:hypothetical protein
MASVHPEPDTRRVRRPTWVNDTHSALNRTSASRVIEPRTVEDVTAEGELVTCDRQHRAELFRHVVGGDGLFGIVTAATLSERIDAGALYGDFQFAIDHANADFLRSGILSCYVPTGDSAPIHRRQRRLAQSDWNRLIEWAHRDKTRAFAEFTEFYLATSGRRYWSDTHQLNIYLESYHAALDQRMGRGVHGGEMITELYVPRERLCALMDDVRRDFVRHPADMIYGTIRLIEPDIESALPWARGSHACMIFNLRVDHDDAAIADATGVFQSDWYRHLLGLTGDQV